MASKKRISLYRIRVVIIIIIIIIIMMMMMTIILILMYFWGKFQNLKQHFFKALANRCLSLKKLQNCILRIILAWSLFWLIRVKACVCYFLSNVYFPPNDSLSKTIKNVFYSSKKLFSFVRFLNFCIFVFPSFFFPVSHCF